MNAPHWHRARDDGVAFTARDDVALVVWSAPATVERGRWLAAQVDVWLAQHRGPVSLVQVILATSKPPDPETRAQARQFLSRMRPRLRLLVTLPVGNELWTVLVRMVLRGLSLFDNDVHSVVVADVDAAIAAIDRAAPLAAAARAELTDTLQKLVRVDTLLAERRASP